MESCEKSQIEIKKTKPPNPEIITESDLSGGQTRRRAGSSLGMPTARQGIENASLQASFEMAQKAMKGVAVAP